MPSRTGGAGRVSTKTKLAADLVILGDILVRAREARGLKQSQVAEALELPASYLSKIEKGNRRLDVIELIHIAEAMEADPAEIIRDVQRALSDR